MALARDPRLRLVLAGAVMLAAAAADAAPSREACLAHLPEPLVERELLPGRRFLVFREPLPAHREEWAASGVRADLVDHVLVSLPDVACTPDRPALSFPIKDYLGHAPGEPRLGRDGWLVRQLDPRTQQLEPSQVKLDAGRRPHHKYENPVGGRPAIGYLDVPASIAETVYRREHARDPQGPFWQVVRERRLPIVLTEGAKKAGALLSIGYAAVSLPGVCGGISMRDERGQDHAPTLRPQLAAMIGPGTEVTIVFDHDRAPRTRRFVRTVLFHTALLLERAGAAVRVVELPGPEKGVDDLLAARGAAAFDALHAAARPFAAWRTTSGERSPLTALHDVGGCD